MIKHTKDILMYKVRKEKNIYNEDEMKQIEEISEKVPKEELINIIYKLSELENKMKMSSQKIIVFETEIIKLCIKTDILGLEERIENLEKVVSNGRVIESNNINHQLENTLKSEKTNAVKGCNKQKDTDAEVPYKNTSVIENKSKPKEQKKENNKMEDISQGNKINEWQNVINNLKSQGKVMLYANLINTDAVKINDMIVSIKFYNGLNEFRKNLIEKHENMNALIKEISIICGKPMQIKLEDASSEKQKYVEAMNNISVNEISDRPQRAKSIQDVEDTTKIHTDDTLANSQPIATDDVFADLDIEVNYIDEE